MSKITQREARSILTKPSGFIKAFDYTLNPYSGCAFGCRYCYAAFFASNSELQEDWGQWVQVKANALELLQRKRKRPLLDKSIYMSSVTDAYQPVEGKLGLTRAIIEELLAYHRVRLVIQTRGTLVLRDVDLLQQFEHVQVNVTITTDDDSVRKAFEPTCPPNAKRIETVTVLEAAGIPTTVTMAPLLPVRDPQAFAETLHATGSKRFVVQNFHTTKRRFIAGTGEFAVQLAAQMGWNEARYREVKAILREHLPTLKEGQEGFLPYWMA